MVLASGTRLGPYAIVAPLGAGAMGHVYRGRDTRLDRLVAIKVLDPRDGDARPTFDRLEREARAISRVTHPNICALYDLGHQDGHAFLVMEYLEGETLARRLETGALPLALALRYGAEIAHALDAAHRAGVIHRDLNARTVTASRPEGVGLLEVWRTSGSGYP